MKLYSIPLIVFFIGNLVSLPEHEFIGDGDIKQKTNSDNIIMMKMEHFQEIAQKIILKIDIFQAFCQLPQ